MKKATLKIYNSLTRQKEEFEALTPPHVGFYVCGPTVYSDVHLGNCRSFISFDVVYRYLTYLGYKVRYVRNITDVGHLENDVDTDAEDRISKRARLEQLEPMEIVQRHTVDFHEVMRLFNNLPPSIEPSATGHLVEQMEMVQQIIDNGYGYEVNGSVYFDVGRLLNDTKFYGQLSGKVVEELLAETRDELKKQDEKRHPSDFAIWVKADERHIMRWNSPWSVGFPGWHLECSAMSTKYLGKQFDIHGGGMDLKFPHHENEIAQNWGACGSTPVRYWMHANMLTLNGRKMSKRDGNNIMPAELFTGNNSLLSQAYSPMVVRFFMLQTHYRSTLDFSDEALKAAEKGYQRLTEAYQTLGQLLEKGATQDPDDAPPTEPETEINNLLQQAFADMDDDFNTPQALSRLFGIVPIINALHHGQLDKSLVRPSVLLKTQADFSALLFSIFGLKNEVEAGEGAAETVEGLMQLLLEWRQQARTQKDWATSDKLRDRLLALGIQVKDGKEGVSWEKI